MGREVKCKINPCKNFDTHFKGSDENASKQGGRKSLLVPTVPKLVFLPLPCQFQNVETPRLEQQKLKTRLCTGFLNQ